MTDPTFVPGPETARAFRDALGRFATGVTVVTRMTDQGPLGITANSFASLSLDPPLVLWAPAKASRRFAAFAEATHFSIHVMEAAQHDVAMGFVRDGGAFAGIDWEMNAERVPVIAGTLARFDCVQEAVHDAGDHAIVIGRVLRCHLGEGRPLIFTFGRYGGFAEI